MAERVTLSPAIVEDGEYGGVLAAAAAGDLFVRVASGAGAEAVVAISPDALRRFARRVLDALGPENDG